MNVRWTREGWRGSSSRSSSSRGIGIEFASCRVPGKFFSFVSRLVILFELHSYKGAGGMGVYSIDIMQGRT